MTRKFFNHSHASLQWRRYIEYFTTLSYPQLFIFWVSLVLIFSLLYCIFSYIPGNGPSHFSDLDLPHRIYNSFYFSIVTATSTGYGDIVPLGFTKVFASIQAILSLFVFAIFVTKLVSQKQDIALQQVHKLTYEAVYYNLREGLFIIRKDFDRAIAIVRSHMTFSQEMWLELSTAYQQAQTLLSDIPDFYKGRNLFFTLDAKRETILQEAVHRTLHRILLMLTTFDEYGIEWRTQEESATALRDFVVDLHHTIESWRMDSPHGNEIMFTHIFSLCDDLQRRISEE